MENAIDLTGFTKGVTCTSRTLNAWNEHYDDGRRMRSPKFLIMHVNVEGNFQKLNQFIDKLKRKPDILCVSETRLDSKTQLNDDIVNNYFAIDHKHCECHHVSNAGGAGILLRKDSQIEKVKILQDYQRIKDLNDCSTKSESVWVRFGLENSVEFNTSPTQATFNVASVYRHKKKVSKNSAEEFVQRLTNAVERLTLPTFVLGDVNIDLFAQESNPNSHAKKVVDNVFKKAKGKLLISENTGRDAETLNDHIYAFKFCENIESGVITQSSFDHHPVYFVAKVKKTAIKQNC